MNKIFSELGFVLSYLQSKTGAFIVRHDGFEFNRLAYTFVLVGNLNIVHAGLDILFCIEFMPPTLNKIKLFSALIR